MSKIAANDIFSTASIGAPASRPLPFDLPSTFPLNRARMDLLDWIVGHLGIPVLEVCDVGTGIGHFAGHLARKHNFRVSAVDIRSSNIEEATIRYPEVRFCIADIEDSVVLSLGTFDVVTSFGLFYHLENPFRAARHLCALARQVVIVESMICSGKGLRAAIVDEFAGVDQAINAVALQLTETALGKLLYCAGMPYVYVPRWKGDHQDFRSGVFRRRMRTMLLGSRTVLPERYFDHLPQTRYALDRAYYSRALPGLILRSLSRLRKILTRS